MIGKTTASKYLTPKRKEKSGGREEKNQRKKSHQNARGGNQNVDTIIRPKKVGCIRATMTVGCGPTHSNRREEQSRKGRSLL